MNKLRDIGIKALLLLLFPALLMAATGDHLADSIVGAEWGVYLKIKIDGMDTGASYNTGFIVANKDTLKATNARAFLRVKRKALDTSGAATWFAETCYVTIPVRDTGLQHLRQLETRDAPNSFVSFHISKAIYKNDSAWLTTQKGLYYSGSDSLAAVTEQPVYVAASDTFSHPRVNGNWLTVPYRRVSDTLTLSFGGIHQSARNFQAVKCVRFWVRNNSGDTVLATVTRSTYDTKDSLEEFVAKLPVAVFDQGDTLTANFWAIGIWGDSTSTLRTSDGVNTQPTPYYAPLTFICDKNKTYATVAVVGDTTGQGVGGSVVDSASFNPNSPPPKYLNIGTAWNAISAYNNSNKGRNNAAGGIIYIDTATPVWTGQTITAGTYLQPSWTRIEPFPGRAQYSFEIDTAYTSRGLGQRLHIKKAAFHFKTSSLNVFSGMQSLWLDSCFIEGPNDHSNFGADTAVYFTNDSIGNWSSGMHCYSNTSLWYPALVRGCVFYNFPGENVVYTFVGNKSYGRATRRTNSFIVTEHHGGISIPPVINAYIANNRFLQTYSSKYTISMHSSGTGTNYHGMALVNNVSENCDSTGQPYWGLCDGNVLNGPIYNVIITGNTTVGACRFNYSYNDIQADGFHGRRFWTFQDNIVAKVACKQDMFDNVDGRRTGGWNQANGVNAPYNIILEDTGSPGSGDFMLEFTGINSYQPQDKTPDAAELENNWIGYVADSGYSGGSPASGHVSSSGGGDYRLKATSPVLHWGIDQMTRFDIKGRLRRLLGAIGAYEAPDTLSLVTADGTTGPNIFVRDSAVGYNWLETDSVKTYLKTSLNKSTWAVVDSTAWRLASVVDTLWNTDLSGGMIYYKDSTISSGKMGGFTYVTGIDSVLAQGDPDSTLYIRKGATGDGSHWDDALDSIPPTLIRGYTYYVAAGVYNMPPTFDDNANGTYKITFKKATGSAHGTNTGWNSAYAEQAVFHGNRNSDGMFLINKPYYTFDGVTGGGPGQWNDSAAYGFKISVAHDPAGDDSVKAFYVSYTNNIKLRHTMLIYDMNQTEPDSTYVKNQDLYYALSSDSSEVSNCYFKYAGRCHMLFRRFTNGLIEYNYFYRNKNCQRQHAQSIDDHGGSNNTIVRYNIFRKNMGTAVFSLLSDGDTAMTTNNYQIYGNVFWGSEGRAADPNRYDITTGVVVVLNDKNANGWTIANNTFYAIDGQYAATPIFDFGDGHCSTCGHRVVNNLIVQSPVGDSVTYIKSPEDGDAVISHWFFGSGIKHATITSQQVGGNGIIPVDSMSSLRFTLTTGTSPGLELETPINVDMYGNVRGADGTWDMGAIEYINTTPGKIRIVYKRKNR